MNTENNLTGSSPKFTDITSSFNSDNSIYIKMLLFRIKLLVLSPTILTKNYKKGENNLYGQTGKDEPNLIRYKIYHYQIEKYAYLPVAVLVEQLGG